jgi:hypothetical protein
MKEEGPVTSTFEDYEVSAQKRATEAPWVGAEGMRGVPCPVPDKRLDLM